jgi:hypothetical protein
MKLRSTSVLKIALMCGALATSLATTGSQASVSHTDHADYVGTGESLTGRCANATTPVNIGRVCFKVRSTDKRVDISSVDTVLGTAGMWYYMRRDGQDLGNGHICGKTPHPILVPAGTSQLDVYPLGAIGVEWCQLDGEETLGAATTGTITARFYNTLT